MQPDNLEGVFLLAHLHSFLLLLCPPQASSPTLGVYKGSVALQERLIYERAQAWPKPETTRFRKLPEAGENDRTPLRIDVSRSSFTHPLLLRFPRNQWFFLGIRWFPRNQCMMGYETSEAVWPLASSPGYHGAY